MIFCIPWHTRHGSLLFFSFGLILHIVKPSHCGLCEPQGELINSFRALPLRLWGTFVCVSKRWWSNCGGVSVTWSMVVSEFYDVWLYQYDAIVGHLLPYTIALRGSGDCSLWGYCGGGAPDGEPEIANVFLQTVVLSFHLA